MKIYLMQHALAYSAEEDQERALNPEGIEQAKASARGIKKLGLSFDLVMTSPKRRAQQTAALIAEAVRYPYSDILTTEALLPNQSPEEVLEILQKESTDSHILVVSHLPYLENLARELMQGGDIHFENSGLTCFDMSGPRTAILEFHLKATQLAI
ncbi:MAG: phosphohistidine phosphatase SixA [Gammaproteobacteria bacterium]|nr:phosphohistidine phosphatase SixA [Phycisphaerae bacterium]NIW44602.1 phosphohistidine phosphatase SixA [Gammaproteobacteria bacterium]NIX02752.1 phosphohistidine phosphatase SixA [Phycisphaerae bacterium]